MRSRRRWLRCVSFTYAEGGSAAYDAGRRYPQLRTFICDVLAQILARLIVRDLKRRAKPICRLAAYFNVRWRVVNTGFEVFCALEPR